jgi:fibronectin type 3 domain-containing protein
MNSRNLGAVIVSIVVVNAIVLAVYGTGQAKVTADYQKNGVQLSWTAPTQRISGERLFSSEIAGYNIFRCVNGEEDYRKINDQLIKDIHYIDRSVEWGMCYSYALTTVDKQGLEGPRSPVVQAIAPLAPPANVKASGLKRSVSLTWGRTNNPQIRGYNIYRSEGGAAQEYRKIACVLDTDSSATGLKYAYLDQEVAVGKNYYYQVSTVDISWQESAHSPEVAATPLVISQEELSTLERVNGFRATVDITSGNGTGTVSGTGAGNGAVILQWESVDLENLAGYNVYRRLEEQGAGGREQSAKISSATLPASGIQNPASSIQNPTSSSQNPAAGNVDQAIENPSGDSIAGEAGGAAIYQKLNKTLLTATTFRDEDVKLQKSYYYLIVAVDRDKNEARFPKELYVTVADLYINSLTGDSGGLPLKGGKTLNITMIAAAGNKASVSLGDVALNTPLRETNQKGVYYGQYIIPQDINRSNLALIGIVQNEQGEKTEYVSKDTIIIDNLPPPGARSVKAQAAEGSVCLNWELSQDLPERSDDKPSVDDIVSVKVFRSLVQGTVSPAGTPGADGAGQGNCAGGNPKELISKELDSHVSSFCDHTVQPGQGYTYSVAVYDKAGNEAFSENCPSLVTPQDSTPPKIYSVKELSLPGTKRAGDVIRIQVTAEAQAKGTFSIGSGISQPLQEVGPGRYLGEYTVQATGENQVISDEVSVASKKTENFKLKTDNSSQAGGTGPVIGSDLAGDVVQNGLVVVELVDASGNRSTLTGDFTVSIDTRENGAKQPEIVKVEHNAFQLGGLNPIVEGDVLHISVQGEPGCTAYADLGAVVSEKKVISDQVSVISSKDGTGGKTDINKGTSVELNWDQDGAVSVSQAGGVDSYRVYCQQDSSPLIFLLPMQGVWPIAELPPGTTHYQIENYQGGYIFVTARKSTGEEQVILTPRMRIPLQEESPGSYEGTYKVQPGDYIRDGQLTACLVNRQGVRSLPVAADDPVTIDTSVSITVTPELKSLKADGKSRTDIQVEVKDVRESGVKNRQIALDLFTTDEYTGIVGVGRLDGSEYGYFDNFYQLVTDFGGKITVPYVSGAAAKTVIMRARDMVTGCIGLSYITSYIEGQVPITLVARTRNLDNGPSLTVWADNWWLTADGGHSNTRVHAKVLDQAGKPLQGRHVTFSVTQGEGRTEEIRSETDSSGEALARYYSGKHIGTAVITVSAAIDKTIVLSNAISINLNSDAPAKIMVYGPDASKPLSLFADGTSHLDLTIRVTDINDNPNRGTPLEVEISKQSEGNGKLLMRDKDAITDFNGECHVTFYAGTKPGEVIVTARALSSIPTPQLLDKIRIAE